MNYAPTAALVLALSALAVAKASSFSELQGPPAEPRNRVAEAGRLVSAAGTVRVIVGLSQAFVPEGRLSAAAAAAQRDGIARAEARLLAGPAAAHIRRSHRFRTIPYTVIEVDPEGLAALAADPNVLDIQYDRLERPTLAQSTALIQATTTTSAGHTGAGWSIAILDTGVERTHGFFGGRVVHEACFSTRVSGQSASLCPAGENPSGQDQQFGTGAAAPCAGIAGCDHGTHVAGIAAGSGASFNGVAPSANLLAFQVFSRFDDPAFCGPSTPCILTYVSDQLRAMEAVLALRSTYNIAAVNMSLGGGQFFSQSTCDASNGSRKAVIDNLRSVGIATVIASGNDGFTDSLSSPGCISTAVSVGSTTDASPPVVSSFSNTATFLSLLAPGSGIQSAIVGNAFGEKSGTSMATPHVAGAFAVLKARSPSSTVAQILTALQNTGWTIETRLNPSGQPINLDKPLIEVNDALIALAPPSCTYSISPASVSVARGSSSGAVTISTQPDCNWSAASSSGFITFPSGNSGSGGGTISYSISANDGVARSGTATIAGQTFTVHQASGCTYAINPTSIDVGPAAEAGTIFVTTVNGCAWTAASHSAFLTVQSSSGTGNGGVGFTLAFNPGAQRTGTATIAGQTFSVTQRACSFDISPASVSFDGFGGSGSITVTTRAGCEWSGVSSSGFLALTNATGRIGSGSLGYTVAENTGGSRSGTATIAGRTFTVDQGAVCDYSLSTPTVNGTDAAASGAITVTTAAGCPWSVSTTARHLTFENGTARTGSGTFSYAVMQNYASVPRSATASVGTQVFTVSQTAAPDDSSIRVRENARADFNGDGRSDLLVENIETGALSAFLMDGHTISSQQALSHSVLDTSWRIAGTGDFNADGKPDIVWHHQTEGWVFLWYMDGTTRLGGTYFSRDRVNIGWRIAGIGDFNADGKPDIVWQNDAEGRIAFWFCDGVTVLGFQEVAIQFVDKSWRVTGVGDFNRDAKADLVLGHATTGDVGVWIMDGATRLEWRPFYPGRLANLDWRVAAVVDANGDDTPDIVWHHTVEGWVAIWHLNGTARMDAQSVPITLPAAQKLLAPK